MIKLKKDQKTFLFLLLFILIVTILSSCGQKYVAHKLNDNAVIVIISNDNIYQTDDTVYAHHYMGNDYPEITDYSAISDKYVIIKKY